MTTIRIFPAGHRHDSQGQRQIIFPGGHEKCHCAECGRCLHASRGGERPWEISENPDISLRRNEFKVNGQKVFYYTMITALPSGDYDCFMMAADFAMILDVDVSVPSAGVLQIHTQTPFGISPAALEQAGYFYGVNGVLAGDATTGEIYYQYQSGNAYPIASTSKLMTCLLTMDALSSGQISLDQTVTVSESVRALSESDDGVIPLKPGSRLRCRSFNRGASAVQQRVCAVPG